MYHYFILLLLFFALNEIKCATYEEEVDYYTELVEDGIADALNYSLPTSADEYRPRHTKTNGNQL